MMSNITRSHIEWQAAGGFPAQAGPVFALTQAAPNQFYAATSSGLVRSSDLAWWRSVPLPSEDAMVSAVAVVPSVTPYHTVLAGTARGVLVSTNGGQDWTVGAGPRPISGVSAVMVSPTFVQDGLAFLGTAEDGVYRSEDRGSYWASWNFGLLDLRVMCLAASPDLASSELLLAGTESGLYRSTNGGRAWREVEAFGEAPVLALLFNPAGGVFAGTENNGLWFSHDAGKTWTRSPALPADVCVNALGAEGAHLAAATNEGLALSNDGGATWDCIEFDQPILSTAFWQGEWWCGTSEAGLWRARHSEE